jgi:hypothetical protein
MRSALFGSSMISCLVAVIMTASPARADSASVSVGRFADPPRAVEPVVVVTDPPPIQYVPIERPQPLPQDPYRAPFRLTLGPAMITSGQGIGPGLHVAADFGTGTVGVRISAAWFRGESPDDPAARLGNALGLYSGELVLDLHKGGPLHPILALGIGALHVSRDTSDGWGVVGLGRLGIEYSLALDDADVRLGAGLTGGLMGPSDVALGDVRAFAMLGATFSLGF